MLDIYRREGAVFVTSVLKFATDRQRAEWADPKLDPTLRRIVEDLALYLLRAWMNDTVITSIYRTPEENDALYGGKKDHLDGVHVEWRGCDISIRQMSSHEVGAGVNFINSRWQYDVKRPMMYCAIPEQGGNFNPVHPDHIHLQSHLDTKKVELVAKESA